MTRVKSAQNGIKYLILLSLTKSVEEWGELGWKGGEVLE